MTTTPEPPAPPRRQPSLEGFALDLMTARALCELPDPPAADRLLGPIVMRGARTVLIASTGHGKTTFTTAIAAAVVGQRDFLGWTGAGGRALILDLEQGFRSAKRRLVEAGLDGSDAVDYVRVPDGLRLDHDDDHRQALERILAERNIDLVVIDPYYKAHGLADSNEERATVELMRLLDRWRERYGFALLLPTHTRKRSTNGDSRFTIDDAFGSSALTRGAEVVIGLELVKPGYSKLHFFKDRDGGDDLPVRGEPWGLLFDREHGFRRDPNDTAPPRDLDAELLELSADQQWRTVKEWKAPKEEGGVGAGEDAVKHALDRLTAAGSLEFAIGPAGRATTARCWRQAGASLFPGHPEAPEAHLGEKRGTAPVPSPSIEGTRGQGTSPALPPQGTTPEAHLAPDDIDDLLTRHADIAGATE